MHLSFTHFDISYVGNRGGVHRRRFDFIDNSGNKMEIEIDDHFFYSVPTSFFAIDSRIPSQLRQLITEAEGCLKSNFLTGASACVRKSIYELAVREGADGDNYDDRIKSLKKIKPDVDGTYFDTLLTVQQMTSSKVHEQSYDGWDAKHLRLIISTVLEILNEIYVIPAVRKEKRGAILAVKNLLLGNQDDSAEE